MEARGYITDEQYWAVMTSLGFDKAKYSLRDERAMRSRTRRT
jgi:hypothetical protein